MNSKDASLVEQLIGSFEKLGDLKANAILDPAAWQLAVGEPDEFGAKDWRPLKQETDRIHLNSLYSVIPSRFPPLYEQLILSYRWADVDLQLFTLFANPPGPDLEPLLKRISADGYLYSHLIGAGYIPFGKGTDFDYDPVCFELKSRKQNADFRIVKIDHEEILCFDRLKVVAEIAPSFRELVFKVIKLAEKTEGS